MAYSADNYKYRSRSQQNDSLSEIRKMGKNDAIQKRFQEVLGAKAPAFIASVIGAVNANSMLQKADPVSVFGSAMIAATLNLSVVPTLGQAALVPYKIKDQQTATCQFQVMVRGLVQLAQRTGLYKTINAGEIYEDEYEDEDLLTGEVRFQRVHGGYRDEGNTDKIIGYFAFMETTTGFRKTEYWTKEDVINHAMRYSKAYYNGPWQDNFDAMAKKTVLKSLLNHYGPMSVDSALAQAITKDQMVVDSNGNESYEDNPMDSFISSDNSLAQEESSALSEREKQAQNALAVKKQEITPENQQNKPETSLDADINDIGIDEAFGAPVPDDDGWGERVTF